MDCKIAQPDYDDKENESPDWEFVEDIKMEQKIYVEIYEYPEKSSPTPIELFEYFATEPWNANCTTAEDEIYNEDTKTFVMEFTETEAARILSHEEEEHYLLESLDGMSRIKFREFVPSKQVLLSSPKDLTVRMLIKHLKDFGILKSIVKELDKRTFLATFSTADEASKFASLKEIPLRTITIGLKLYHATECHEPSALTSPNFDSDVGNCNDVQGLYSEPSNSIASSAVMSESHYRMYGHTAHVYADNLGTQKGDSYQEGYESSNLHGATSEGFMSNSTQRSVEEASLQSSCTPIQSLSSTLGSTTTSKTYSRHDSTESFSPQAHRQHTSQLRTGTNRKATLPWLLIQAERPENINVLRKHFENTSMKEIKQIGEDERKFLVRVLLKEDWDRLRDAPVITLTGNRLRVSVYQPSPPTHVEVEMLPGMPPEVMHQVMQMHLTQLYSQCKNAVFQQSYDEANGVLRFDLPAEDIKNLLNSKQPLITGNPKTALKLKPRHSGKVIKVVAKDARKMKLDQKQLLSYFGEEGPFRCRVNILRSSSDEAILEFETFSVSRLVVSIGRHTLRNNVVLETSFSNKTAELTQHTDTDKSKVVLAETSHPYSVLKKLMEREKHKGTFQKRLDVEKYLIAFESVGEATKVVDDKVRFNKHNILLSFYFPPLETPTAVSEYTHIEVKKHALRTAEEMHKLLEIHCYDEGPTLTKFEHSYDNIQEVFRFDMQPSDISVLLLDEQYLDAGDKTSKFDVVPKKTGRRIIIKSMEKKACLSSSKLQTAFGSKSKFASEILSMSKSSDYEYAVEMETCSVASLLVSIGKHKLKGGIFVEALFSKEQTSSDSSDCDDIEEEEMPRPKDVSKSKSITASPTALLLSNLLDHDIDHEILRCWIKSASKVWPTSVQLSASRERAIVKLPAHPQLDVQSLVDGQSEADLRLYEESVSVIKVNCTKKIQVLCFTKQKGASIDRDDIDVYFTNPKFTGIKDPTALVNIEMKTVQHFEHPVFIITYSDTQDVTNLLQRKAHKTGVWEFDVAEFWAEIGLCNSNSLTQYEEEHFEDVALKPALLIKDIKRTELDILKLYMANDGRSGGGDIEFCDFLPGKPGIVKLIFKNAKAHSERVYEEFYLKNKLCLEGEPLEIELVLPYLTDKHDKYRVRVSGLTEELDPEKLKFYLAAISNNVVTQMSFNKQQTRAIALFKHPLDFGRLLCGFHNIPFPGCPDLNIQPEPMPRDLIACGAKLTEQRIVLPLENYLSSKLECRIWVSAEKLPEFNDRWKISTAPEALQLALEGKHVIRDCDKISVYSHFLGPSITNGVRKVANELSNFVTDKLLLKYLLAVTLPGHNLLAKYLNDQGVILTHGGSLTIGHMTVMTVSRNSSERWSGLQQLIDKFLDEKFSSYSTGPIDQEIYLKIQRKDKLRILFENEQVLSRVTAAKENQKSYNAIEIAGLRESVDRLKANILNLRKHYEKDIQDERAMTDTVLNNVFPYQMEYFEKINLFDELKQNYPKIRSIECDIELQRITISGLPGNIEAVRKSICELLPKIEASVITASVSKTFVNVFRSKHAQDACKQALLKGNIIAVWTLHSETISIHSLTKSASEQAKSVIVTTVLEYSQDLDEFESKVVGQGIWRSTKAAICSQYEPLVIEEKDHKCKLFFVGLSQHKNAVLGDIHKFLEENVHRFNIVRGSLQRIRFLNTFRTSELRNLERQHNVTIPVTDDQHSFKIIGTKNSIASCEPFLMGLHNAILLDAYPVNDHARIQHISDNPEILELIGLTTGCILAAKNIEESAENAIESAAKKPPTVLKYSVTLPSGVMCEVHQGNITSIVCDGIVSSSDDHLNHIHGVAAAIVKEGKGSIQQECNKIVKDKGKLLLWTAITTAGGDLPCQKIIHAVCPHEIDKKTYRIESLNSCIGKCFDEASKDGMQSLAIPPICNARFGVSNVVKSIVDTVAFRESSQKYLPQRIVLIDIDGKSLLLFEKLLQSEFGSTSPFSSQRVANTGSTSRYTVNQDTVTIQGRVLLEVKTGDLAVTQVDSLVISVGDDMKLSGAGASSAVSKMAGPQLQDECTRRFGSIKEGEVRHTSSGYKLPCKMVVCCNCPSATNKSSPKSMLKNIIIECLTQSANGGLTSVAFPALGTGNLRFSGEDCAFTMIEGVMDYVEMNAGSSLSNVKIVIHYKDTNILKAFQEELKRLSTAPQKPLLAKGTIPRNLNAAAAVGSKAADADLLTADLKGNASLKGYITLNSTTIRIILGDIAEHKADVLVNSASSATGTSMDTGQVSKALLARAGQSLSKEVSHMISTDKAPADGIWVTTAGKLDAHFIFHVNVDHMGSEDSETGDLGFKALVSNCLKRFDSIAAGSSIAFPALATGNLRHGHKDMAKIMFESVGKYLNGHPRSCLKKIDLVIYTHKMAEDFVNSLKKTTKKPEPWWTNFRGVPKFVVLKFCELGAKLGGATNEPLAEDKVLQVDIYAGSYQDIEACKRELEAKLDKAMQTIIWSEKLTYPSDRDNIGRLSQLQVKRLYEVAHDLHVHLEIQQELYDIKIYGLNENTQKVADHVSAELATIGGQFTTRREERLLAQGIQWQYQENGEWLRFDDVINKQLEDKFQMNAVGSHKYATGDGGSVDINFSQKQGSDVNGTFAVRRQNFGGGPIVPDSWTLPYDRNDITTLQPNSLEYKTVVSNFERTLKAKAQVIQIQRIQNLALYEQYLLIRGQTAKRLKKAEDHVDVERQPLWHGTNEDTVEKIAKGKFDRGYSSRHVYGQGSYFAVNTSYSANKTYSQPNARGEQFILQARVVTGEYCVGSAGLRAAPNKPHSNTDLYDSVVDKQPAPTIFVVFHDAAAYPEYIIQFKLPV